jgi:hypothetical protein
VNAAAVSDVSMAGIEPISLQGSRLCKPSLSHNLLLLLRIIQMTRSRNKILSCH